MVIKRLFTALGLLLAVAMVLISVIHFRPRNLLANQSWTVKGPAFTKGGAWAYTKFDPEISLHDQTLLDYWGSWSGSNPNTGELRSPIFKAPSILECYLSGYPGKPGLELFLERASDHSRFPLTVPGNSFPAEIWRAYHWRLPSDMRGQPVQLVAIDNNTEAWMGVSTPRAFSRLALLHRQLPPNLLFLAEFVWDFTLLLLPGCAVGCLLVSRWPSLLRYSLILIVVSSAAFGYLSFYTFFFSTPGGRWFSYLIYLGSSVVVVYLFRQPSVLPDILRQIADPLTITAVAALCYLCFAYLFINPLETGAGYINGRFYDKILPGDNLIPVLFANKIYDHQPLVPFCCGGWLTSDRPPLQTGISLLQRPLTLTNNVELNYEVLAVGLQCLWICGVWSFLTSLGTAQVNIRRSLVLLIFSGFNFYNSVYVWPKFLAATFILFALSIVIDLLRARRPASYSDAVLAAICIGLALVSHPGSVFSLITFVIVYLKFRPLFPLQKLALVLPILLAFVLPWTAYQKLVDPPGDRLVKWHLAGHTEISNLTAGQAIREAYTTHSLAQILDLRWGNVRELIAEKPFEKFGLDDFSHAAAESTRMGQREFVWNAVGVLNFGWLATLFRFWHKPGLAVPFARWIILAALANMLFWCCIEFGPKYTVTTTMSYADLLLLSIGLMGFILTLPRVLYFALLALQLFNFFSVWVWSPPYLLESLAGTIYTVIFQLPLSLFGLLFASALIGSIAKSAPAFSSAGLNQDCDEANYRADVQGQHSPVQARSSAT